MPISDDFCVNRYFLCVSHCWQIDIPAVFADKVMKAAMKHIEIIAKAHQRGMHVSARASFLICVLYSVVCGKHAGCGCVAWGSLGAGLHPNIYVCL